MNDWIEWTTSYGQTEGPIPRVISSVPISIHQYFYFYFWWTHWKPLIKLNAHMLY
jgi:hypothetical protein